MLCYFRQPWLLMLLLRTPGWCLALLEPYSKSGTSWDFMLLFGIPEKDGSFVLCSVLHGQVKRGCLLRIVMYLWISAVHTNSWYTYAWNSESMVWTHQCLALWSVSKPTISTAAITCLVWVDAYVVFSSPLCAHACVFPVLIDACPLCFAIAF